VTESDAHHPVIDRAWEWSIVGLTYAAPGEIEAEACLDLRLRRGPEVRCLRFLDPRSLQIGGSFPHVGWLLVSDIRARGLDGLGVLVRDGEMDEAISFYARSVKDVDPAT
jgi:hypothetical protein